MNYNWNFSDFEVASKGSINNKSSLVQVMAWHQTNAKPLPETNSKGN